MIQEKECKWYLFTYRKTYLNACKLLVHRPAARVNHGAASLIQVPSKIRISCETYSVIWTWPIIEYHYTELFIIPLTTHFNFLIYSLVCVCVCPMKVLKGVVHCLIKIRHLQNMMFQELAQSTSATKRESFYSVGSIT